MFGLQDFPYRVLAKVAAVGAVAGILQLAIYYGLMAVSTSTNGGLVEAYVPLTLMIVSIIFAHFLGLIGLIRLNVSRPLLVVLAVIATLWGVWSWIETMPWWLEGLVGGLLFAVAYCLFAWINRLLSFPVVLIVSIAIILISRMVFISL